MCFPLRVDPCCRVCTLQTSTKIVAFLSLAGCVAFVYQNATWLAKYEEFEKANPLLRLHFEILITNIVLGVIQIPCSLMALEPAYNGKNKKLLLPWLVSSAVGMVAFCVLALYKGMKILFFQLPFGFKMAILFGVTLLGVLCLYIWLVVYSYYNEINGRRKEKNSGELIKL